MTFFASVNGQQVVSGQLMIPLVGAWTADLQLATSNPVTGNATVTIGNLTLQGYVYRSEVYGGQTRARLVAGYGGWRTVIDSQGYGSSSGIQLSTVLNDAAQACGEQINPTSGVNIGNAYTRAESIASDILWQMVSQGFIPAWYVATSGVTQVTAWPNNTIQTPFTVTEQRPDEGLIVIATEDYASWMPGCQFSSPLLTGSYTSGGVNYVWDADGKFRFEVLTGTTDRFIGALQATIQRQIAPTRFYGRYAYSISNPTTTTVDAEPVNTKIGLPELQNVTITGDSISTYTPPSGGTCHIMFLDGIPTQPVCVWTSSPPSHADLLNGTTPAVKLGDTVQSYVTGGLTVLAGGLTLTIAAPFVPGTPNPCVVTAPSVLTVQGLNPISGTITTGSSMLSVPGT